MNHTNDIRCPKCSKKVAEAAGPTNIKVVCQRCKHEFEYNNKKTDKILIEGSMGK